MYIAIRTQMYVMKCRALIDHVTITVVPRLDYPNLDYPNPYSSEATIYYEYYYKLQDSGSCMFVEALISCYLLIF